MARHHARQFEFDLGDQPTDEPGSRPGSKYLGRFRRPLTEAELAEDAAEFECAVIALMQEVAREVEEIVPARLLRERAQSGHR